MRFSEELSQLVDRFREVQVTFDGSARMPERVPDGWLQKNTSAFLVTGTAESLSSRRESS